MHAIQCLTWLAICILKFKKGTTEKDLHACHTPLINTNQYFLSQAGSVREQKNMHKTVNQSDDALLLGIFVVKRGNLAQ